MTTIPNPSATPFVSSLPPLWPPLWPPVWRPLELQRGLNNDPALKAPGGESATASAERVDAPGSPDASSTGTLYADLRGRVYSVPPPEEGVPLLDQRIALAQWQELQAQAV